MPCWAKIIWEDQRWCKKQNLPKPQKDIGMVSFLISRQSLQAVVLWVRFGCQVDQSENKGWREGSVVKRTGCYSGGPGLDSQHPQGGQQSNSSSRGSSALFWLPWVLHRHTCRRSIHTCKINKYACMHVKQQLMKVKARNLKASREGDMGGFRGKEEMI